MAYSSHLLILVAVSFAERVQEAAAIRSESADDVVDSSVHSSQVKLHSFVNVSELKTNKKATAEEVHHEAGLPVLGGLQASMDAGKTAIKAAIMLYAGLNDKRCPTGTELSVVALGVEDDYLYGGGCGFEGENLCGCPNWPLNVCATSGRISNPSGLTGIFIGTFGYCRTGLWFMIGVPVTILIGIGVFLKLKQSKQSEGDN